MKFVSSSLMCAKPLSVPHLPLLDQLQAINVNPYLLKWISSYNCPKGFNFIVTVEGEASDKLPAVSGIPQGSVLGPLLFVMYINNVATTISQDSKMNMFADDITYYRVVKSLSDYVLFKKIWIAHLHLCIASCWSLMLINVK